MKAAFLYLLSYEIAALLSGGECGYIFLIFLDFSLDEKDFVLF